MRRAAKVDANHAEVVAALRKAGFSVVSISRLGCGIPDLLVGGTTPDGRPTNWILEVKDGRKPPSARKLTDDEAAFMAAWKGQYAVVETAEQAIALVTA